ncbi:hypothetical protein [Odoribacter lunatus]|uniref:hypothetical protein n=1 Tax=Odoribacter lunatus TaxID=2941335 RepID=UPI00203B6C1F|nr:hypothetical protein [Odoribacter lunatus]
MKMEAFVLVGLCEARASATVEWNVGEKAWLRLPVIRAAEKYSEDSGSIRMSFAVVGKTLE